MAWPTPSDYQDSIQNPATCFSDPRLRAARVALGPLGLPKVASGNYCSVYEMRSGTRRWAVRCFNRQVPDAEQRYHTIDEHLNRHPMPWLVGFDFLKEGIRIRGRWYPIIVMDWVEGVTLSRYLEKRVQDSAAVRVLADKWPAVMAGLRGSQIAHGDLQHGNILVAHEEYRLVDYDNLFVPAFQGKPSPELGRLHYQHPARTADDFDVDIGNFAALVIYLSLRALAADSSLWRAYNGENLVLTAEDYQRTAASATLARMRASMDPLVPRLAAELARCCALPVSQIPPLEAVLASLSLSPGGGTAAPAAPRPRGGSPDWLEAPPPSRGGRAALPSTQPAPAPAGSDPWWETPEQPPTEAPAPAPPPSRRRGPGRPGWMSSSRRPAPGGGAGAGTVALPRGPVGTALEPFSCVVSLVRSCMLLVLIAVAALAGTGWWLYQHWEAIDPFGRLPPVVAPPGDTGGSAPPGIPPSPPGPPSRDGSSGAPSSGQSPRSDPPPEPLASHAMALLEKAIDQLQAGDAAAAHLTLSRARGAGLDLDDEDTARRFFSALAEARYCTGRYAESLPAFERALSLDPANDRLQRLHAAAQMKREQQRQGQGSGAAGPERELPPGIEPGPTPRAP